MSDLFEDGVLLRIFIGEADRADASSLLFEKLILAAKELGIRRRNGCPWNRKLWSGWNDPHGKTFAPFRRPARGGGDSGKSRTGGGIFTGR